MLDLVSENVLLSAEKLTMLNMLSFLGLWEAKRDQIEAK